MIAYIEGKCAEKAPTHVIIDCGGVGYFIKISLNTYAQITDAPTLKLHTYLQIREDAHTLYGFADLKEKTLFELLISVSGVGSNTALMVLSGLSPAELSAAIRQQKTAVLKGIKGIGAKTAERVILELKDKIPVLEGEATSLKPSAPGLVIDSRKKEEALQALVGLGFNKQQMEAKVNDILQREGESISLSDLIKMAMKT